ncbi:MAG: hypothetical protein JOZ08_08115 [Verrucomicrobia bacterium]|nr:hypothetical protein [Verrucomicrobiota bacterium]
MTQLVVPFAVVALSGLLVWVWFLGLSPLRHVRSEAKRRRWSLEEDSEGLWYRLTGNKAGMAWLAEWNGRGPRPYVELSVPDTPAIDSWCFITTRERHSGQPPRFLAGAFTGKTEPEWVAEWMHAKVIETGFPEFDRDFVVEGSSPFVPEQLPIQLLERLGDLPAPLLSKIFVIRGKGKLVFHVEETGRADALSLIERLMLWANQALV